jgi:DNA polymerase III delta subunit
LKNDLVSKFGSKIEERALDELIRLKSENYNKIAMEIEKLNISIPVINISDVKENVMPELEESVFEIANDILDRNKV